MLEYIIRRLLVTIPVVLLVTLMSFFVMELVPGDPAALIAGSEATEEEINALREQLGLNMPLLERLANWYGALARGDLGQSLLLQTGVTEALLERVPVTLSLACFALSLAVVMGTTAGVVAAVFRDSWIDHACMTTALFGVSVPNFWFGIVLIYTFSVFLGVLPTGGYVPFSESPLGWARSLILPALALGLLQMGLLARITRSAMLEILNQDFVRTARAKGLPTWKVVLKHALRNAVIPIVTVIGIMASSMVSGSVVIETVFSLPGIGRLIVQAIMRRDFPVIQGGLVATAVAFVLINLIIDVLYYRLDPRIQLKARK